MAYSQNNLYAQQPMNMNRSRSSSPQPQMTAAQQQWMAAQYQQQAMSNNNSNRSSMNSMQDIMAQHQKQWKEHQRMTSQNNLIQQIPEHSPSPSPNLSAMSGNSQMNMNQQMMNQGGSAMNLNQNMMNQGGSAMNLNQNQYTAAQYAAWQRQYQQQQNIAASAMNMQNYQMQQQRMAQMQQQQAMMAQRQQQQAMMAQQNSQRALFQQQARNNQNYYASTGNLGANNNNRMNNNNNFNSFRSVPANRGKLDEEREESIDHQHESFVPPAPQSNKEVKKYVEWRAKRAGIDEQKEIDREIAKRQSMAVASTAAKQNGTFTKKEVDNFKTPLLDKDVHKESIDYELGQNYDPNGNSKSGGCCCVVL